MGIIGISRKTQKNYKKFKKITIKVLTKKNKSYIMTVFYKKGQKNIFLKGGYIMKNIDVIQTFIKEEGREKAKTKNLYIDTEQKALINYNTVIARWNGTEEQTKELEIDVNYYSTTTSKIQTYIVKMANQLKQEGYSFYIVLNGTQKRVEQYSHYIDSIVVEIKGTRTEQEEQEERNILLNSFITGDELYTNLFYREYKQVNIKDILSQYIYELEQRITTEEKTQAQKTVASAIQRHFIG